MRPLPGSLPTCPPQQAGPGCSQELQIPCRPPMREPAPTGPLPGTWGGRPTGWGLLDPNKPQWTVDVKGKESQWECLSLPTCLVLSGVSPPATWGLRPALACAPLKAGEAGHHGCWSWGWTGLSLVAPECLMGPAPPAVLGTLLPASAQRPQVCWAGVRVTTGCSHVGDSHMRLREPHGGESSQSQVGLES